MGQIAQNRCYTYVWRLFSTELNFENETEKIKNRSDGKKNRNNIENEIDFFNCGDFAIVKVVEFDNFKNR